MSQIQPEWESFCKRCGLCCFEKIEDESGTIFFTRTPCRYLDVVSRECRIYDRRQEICPDCIQLTPELVAGLRWLHDGCGYREMMMSNSNATKAKGKGRYARRLPGADKRSMP